MSQRSDSSEGDASEGDDREGDSGEGPTGDSSEGPAVEANEALHIHQHQEPAEFMTFTIIGARGFRNPDRTPIFISFLDFYVVIESNGQKIAQTSVLQDSLEPLWMEEFEYKEWEEGAEFEFHLYEEGRAESHCLGKATIQNDRFQDGFNGDLQLQETDCAYLRIKIKPPGKVYPPGSPMEFELTLEKDENNSYGIDVDTQDSKTLYIKGLIGGPASNYNLHAAPEFHLVRGDFIVEANGASGDARAMLLNFRDDATVAVKVRRGIDVTLILERKNMTNEDGIEGDLQPLGIEWPQHKKGDGLVVTAVNEGLFADWNESQTEDPVAKLQVGDRIIRVGNTTGRALALAKAIQEVSGEFLLTLLRAPAVAETPNQAWFSTFADRVRSEMI